MEQSRALMDEGRVDPIQYAWAVCNPSASLPPLLAKGMYRDPLVGRVETQVQAARAATLSGIVRRRVPRTPYDVERSKI